MSNDADPPEPDPSVETPTDEPEAETGAEHDSEDHRRRWPLRRHRDEDDESFAHRLAHQWALVRDERRHEPEPITGGRSNFSRAQVPWGLDLAAAWAWRVLVIAGAGYAIFWLLGFFAVITLPLVVALLISALVIPLVDVMDRAGLPRGLASLIVVLGGLAAVAVLLTFVGQQVAGGASDLADSTVEGLGEIKDWLKDGPLHASDSQIDSYIEQMQDAITERSQDGEVLSQVTEVGATLGHVLAGFFIVLFSTFFFLADGERIWSWAVRLAPRGRAGAGRQLGPGRLDLAHPVRPRDRDRRARRRHRDHDRRRDHRRAVRAGDRRAGVPRRVRPDGRVPPWPARSRCWSRSSTRDRSPRSRCSPW